MTRWATLYSRYLLGQDCCNGVGCYSQFQSGFPCPLFIVQSDTALSLVPSLLHRVPEEIGSVEADRGVPKSLEEPFQCLPFAHEAVAAI